jgi:anti-anti-sigma regulatory factor
VNANTDVALHIETSDTILVKWTGRAADRRPAAVLEPVFDRLLELGRDLVFDLSGLEHISSSTMVVIMKFVKRITALGLGIDFQYDETVSWQRMTFGALRSLAAPRAELMAA